MRQMSCGAECEKASQLAEKLSGLKGHLADSAATLLDFLRSRMSCLIIWSV